MGIFASLVAIVIAGAGIFIFVYELLFEAGILHHMHAKRVEKKKIVRKKQIAKSKLAPVVNIEISNENLAPEVVE